MAISKYSALSGAWHERCRKVNSGVIQRHFMAVLATLCQVAGIDSLFSAFNCRKDLG